MCRLGFRRPYPPEPHLIEQYLPGDWICALGHDLLDAERDIEHEFGRQIEIAQSGFSV